MVEQLISGAKDTMTAMTEKNPFNTWMLFLVSAVIAFFAWQFVVYNERSLSQTERLVDLQVETNIDRRDKTAAMLDMAKAQRETSRIAKVAAEATLQTAKNLQNLLIAVDERTAAEEKDTVIMKELLKDIAHGSDESTEVLLEMHQDQQRTMAPTQ